ncbi:ABC transporter substrate-binding protein [Rhodococcoides yunnanense]|uniref:ABC transporter substrate-binding protein n=1 Tax=Rhodococcoides yunnanense TaxID=278209 RepID=UPI0009320C9B|nr:ABC transporter substrate-binding protein [Rhodococcus yunnanensis]
MQVKKITAAVLTVGLFALAGCSSDDSGGSGSGDDASQPFRVTYVTSTSGALAPFAAAVTASLTAAVKQINVDGGILGRQVEVTTIDDGSEPTKAVNAAQSIVNGDDTPDVVIPGIASMTSIPTLPIYARANIPTVSTGTSTEGNKPEEYPLNYGVSNTPAQSITALLGHLKDEGKTSIAVVTVNNEAGQSTLKTLESEAAAAGITITDSQALEASTVDATAALSKLQAGNPQVLVVPGIQGPLVGAIFKDRVKLGWDVPTYTDVVTTANDLVSVAGGQSNLQGVTLQEVPYGVAGDPTRDTEAFDKFVTGFKAEMPDPVLPMGVLGAGWSAMAFTQGLFDKAGSTDPDDLAAAAYELKTTDAPLWFQTPGPSFGIDSDNHYVVYGQYAYAPAGPRDDMGSLLPSAN